MIYYLVTLIVIILDRISKWLVVKNLELYQTVPVIGNFFMITSHRNTGAAFSILENQRLFFIVITIVIAAGLIWYLYKLIRQGERKLLPFALSMVLGGAIGNLIDRIATGQVVDFLQFHFKFTLATWHIDYIFAVFNLADSSIFIGVVLIFIDSLIHAKKEEQRINSNEA